MAKTLEERIEELEGKDVATRVKALETVTRRQARKKQKKISGVLFPYPICASSVPDRNGVILRVMFPCDGSLIKALVDIEGVEALETPADIQAEVKIENDVYVRDFSISKRMQEFDIELPVLKGSKLRVKTTTPEVQGFAWVSLLFVPAISDAKIRKIVMESKDAEET